MKMDIHFNVNINIPSSLKKAVNRSYPYYDMSAKLKTRIDNMIFSELSIPHTPSTPSGSCGQGAASGQYGQCRAFHGVDRV